jgi:elongation factor Tu
MPGDHASMDVMLITEMAMEAGTRFAILDGGRRVGVGVVSEVPGPGGGH